MRRNIVSFVTILIIMAATPFVGIRLTAALKPLSRVS